MGRKASKRILPPGHDMNQINSPDLIFVGENYCVYDDNAASPDQRHFTVCVTANPSPESTEAFRAEIVQGHGAGTTRDFGYVEFALKPYGSSSGWNRFNYVHTPYPQDPDHPANRRKNRELSI